MPNMKVVLRVVCAVWWSAHLHNTPYGTGHHKLEQLRSLIFVQQISTSEVHDAVKNFHWCLKIRSLEELLKGRKGNSTGKVTYYDTRKVEYRESSFVNGNIFGDDSKGSACIRETGNRKTTGTSKERHCQSCAFNFLMSNNNFHSNSVSSELHKNQANKQNMHT